MKPPEERRLERSVFQDADPSLPGAQGIGDWYKVHIEGEDYVVLAGGPRTARIYAAALFQDMKRRNPRSLGSPTLITEAEARAIGTRISSRKARAERGAADPVHPAMLEVRELMGRRPGEALEIPRAEPPAGEAEEPKPRYRFDPLGPMWDRDDSRRLGSVVFGFARWLFIAVLPILGLIVYALGISEGLWRMWGWPEDASNIIEALWSPGFRRHLILGIAVPIGLVCWIWLAIWYIGTRGYLDRLMRPDAWTAEDAFDNGPWDIAGPPPPKRSR